MSTTLITYAAAEFTTRWEANYFSEELNRKLLPIPRGVYRGFGLATNAAALSVTLVADPTQLDHLAVVQTQNGYSITVRKTGGNATLNLAPQAGNTVILALYSVYSTGVTSTATLIAYTTAEWAAFSAAEQAERTVIGTVVVPAAGVIPAANITYGGRVLPTDGGPLEWAQVLRNPQFEHGVVAGKTVTSIEQWLLTNTLVTDAYAALVAAGAETGPNCLEVVGVAANPTGIILGQYLGVCVETGRAVRLRVRAKRLLVPAVVVTSEFNLMGVDAAGGAVLYTLALPLTGVDANYVTYEGTWVSAGGVLQSLFYVLSATMNVGQSLLIDSVEVFVEGRPPRHDLARTERMGPLGVVKGMTLGGGVAALATDLEVLHSSGMTTFGDRGAVAPPVMNWKGQGRFGAGLLAAAADARTARMAFATADPALVSALTLIEELNPYTAGDPVTRFYYGDLGGGPGLFITVNAAYTGVGGAEWAKDFAAQGSLLVQVGSWGTISIASYRAAGATPFASAAWGAAPQTETNSSLVAAEQLLELANGKLWLSGPQAAGAKPSNPAYNAAILKNALYAKNIPKAFGKCSIAAGVLTVDDGLGFDAALTPGAPAVLTVTFTNAFGNANYTVVPSVNIAGFGVIQAQNQAVGSFDLAVADMAGTPVDLDDAGTTCVITFAVYGEQT